MKVPGNLQVGVNFSGRGGSRIGVICHRLSGSVREFEGANEGAGFNVHKLVAYVTVVCSFENDIGMQVRSGVVRSASIVELSTGGRAEGGRSNGGTRAIRSAEILLGILQRDA